MKKLSVASMIGLSGFMTTSLSVGAQIPENTEETVTEVFESTKSKVSRKTDRGIKCRQLSDEQNELIEQGYEPLIADELTLYQELKATKRLSELTEESLQYDTLKAKIY